MSDITHVGSDVVERYFFTKESYQADVHCSTLNFDLNINFFGSTVKLGYCTIWKLYIQRKVLYSSF